MTQVAEPADGAHPGKYLHGRPLRDYLRSLAVGGDGTGGVGGRDAQAHSKGHAGKGQGSKAQAPGGEGAKAGTRGRALLGAAAVPARTADDPGGDSPAAEFSNPHYFMPKFKEGGRLGCLAFPLLRSKGASKGAKGGAIEPALALGLALGPFEAGALGCAPPKEGESPSKKCRDEAAATGGDPLRLPAAKAAVALGHDPEVCARERERDTRTHRKATLGRPSLPPTRAGGKTWNGVAHVSCVGSCANAGT
jgi:hypothetical protein